MELHTFINKWQSSKLKERAGSQEHFVDLCRLLKQPTPAEADSAGAWFTFEKGAKKQGGGKGFADVWMRGHFAWEYKGKHANLEKAYAQLLQYRSDLENPPLLIVSDMDVIEIHTNFTGTAEQVTRISLNDLFQNPAKLKTLQNVFTDPETFHPGVTVEQITQAAAARFADLADLLRKRYEPEVVAHFLSKVLFALFAEDAKLLPSHIISDMIKNAKKDPKIFNDMLRKLFNCMTHGGTFGTHKIEYFNGGLFNDDVTLDLNHEELEILRESSGLDWGAIEPSIFGTLFERGLDPGKRSQLGQHYTHRSDIERLIFPLLVDPIMEAWPKLEQKVDALLAKAEKARKAEDTKFRKAAKDLIDQFLEKRVRSVKVLDPACGSGNFLYIALEKLHEIEKICLLKLAQVNRGQLSADIRVGPQQVYGIEINTYAHELAQVTVWIGHLQWMINNGFGFGRDPVLRKLDNIANFDAIVEAHRGRLTVPTWPKVDVIIGNPPFLGHHKIANKLGEGAKDLFTLYKGKVGGRSDIVCYWFHLAHEQIRSGLAKRAGFVSTNSIRGGTNRKVLDAIAEDCNIYDAWSDEEWIVEGAAVRTSLVCFAKKQDKYPRHLNGSLVSEIFTDLTAEVIVDCNASIDKPNMYVVGQEPQKIDATKAIRLKENIGVAFKGTTRNGPFDIDGELARRWLLLPSNANGCFNSDVLRPFANAKDITQKSRDKWIIDFGVDMSEKDAAFYEKPFEHVREHVVAAREKREKTSATEGRLFEQYWLFQRTWGL